MTTPPRLRPEQLDDEGRELVRAIVAGPRASVPGQFPLQRTDGSLTGPFGLFLLAPPLGAPLQELGVALRTRATLDDATRELATLAAAVAAGSAFEIAAHVPLARTAGVDEDVLDLVLAGGDPPEPARAAAVGFARAAVRDAAPAAAFEALGDHFDDRARFELITLVAYYRALATMLALFGVEPDDEENP
jgi:4-carboxymuconolactone decarboxylase